ncbi:MAG: hypothetical protein ABI646_05110 [Acidobacteriota bacterium]
MLPSCTVHPVTGWTLYRIFWSWAPGLRLVAVIERNDLDSHAEAIKLVAVGIVHTVQNPKNSLTETD